MNFIVLLECFYVVLSARIMYGESFKFSTYDLHQHRMRIGMDYSEEEETTTTTKPNPHEWTTIDSNRTYFHPALIDKFRNAKKLYLTNFNITNILPRSFTSFNCLQEMHLDRNHLEEIDPDTFFGLTNLTLLNLSHNNLSILQNLDSNLIELEELNVSDNDLTTIDENSFKYMSKLKVLNLHNNKLYVLDVIDQLYTLNILNLSMNQFHYFSTSDFEKLTSLEILDISDNFIRDLPPKIFYQSPKLTKVNLKNNEISNLTNIFKNSVSYIDISLNVLQYVYCEQFNGTVILSANYLNTICISNETKSLIIHTNDIEEIKNEQFKNSNLILLDLSSNIITKLNFNSFEGLAKLETLLLQDNMISSIPIGTFRHLERLETLNLSRNHIESIEHGLLTNLGNLTYLDLSKNKIKSLDFHVFYPVKNLTTLFLHGNNLKSFDTDELKTHLSKLEEVSFHSPTIDCNELYKYLEDISRYRPWYDNIKNLNVKFGENVMKHNVHGIQCKQSPNDETTIEPIAYINDGNRSIKIAFILTATILFILILIHCLSYDKYISNYTRKSMNKTGAQCSLALLTEEQNI